MLNGLVNQRTSDGGGLSPGKGTMQSELLILLYQEQPHLGYAAQHFLG